ncbi:MAG: phage tail assembly chaperone [Sphingomonadaceae bacterium]
MKLFAELAMVAARFATGRLAWPADRFWDATVAELQTAVEGALGLEASSQALSAADLARLKELFPDG